MKKLFHLNQFHIKYKGCIWWDLCSGTPLSVCKVVRDVKLPFVTLFHKLKGLYPSCNNLGYTKCCSFAPLV